jgi:predicted anti-sigma-YlaC factor YlaD
MKLMPTCQEVQTLATEYREGALPFSQRLRIRLHLLLCWACRAFLRGLEALPRVGKKLAGPEPETPPAAKAALEAVLRRMAAGGESQGHS